MPGWSEATPPGLIFDVQRFSIHDGPGIRTVVFLKGCPLRCAWCANPESQLGEPQMAWFESLCIGCGRCAEACPNGAITMVDGRPVMDRAVCVACGACAEACGRGARRLMGAEMSVDRVMDEVRRDAVFYRRSGGGVTFSGGEPLLQAEFVTECLRLSKRWGYHTAVETCGHVAWEDLQAAAEHSDLFLYDVKLVDPERHREWMGSDNRRIVENLERLLGVDAQVIVRTPIVPGCNDDEDSLEALAGFAAAHPRVRRFELLPYHRLGLHKYAALDMAQPDSLEEPPDGRLEVMARRVAVASGAECVVTHGLK